MIRRCRPLLGTFVEIAAPTGCEAAIAAAFGEIARVHQRMSFHDETSDLAALRRARPDEIVEVDGRTTAVLRLAADLHRRSAGLFDVTIGRHLVAYGFLPLPAGIDPGTMDGGATDIEIVDDHHIRCHRRVLIDLGGIAKGFAVDRAIAVLAARGVRNAIVNAGGDLRVLGDRPERVHLREADGTLGPVFAIADAALASSANLSDRRIAHGRIVTPHLGHGSVPVIAAGAVTIVAGRCVIADAMTKIALADPGLAAAMLTELDGAIVARPVAQAA